MATTKLFALCALLLAACLAASEAKIIEPSVGDVGTMSKCEKSLNDDDKEDECRTCKEEREEDEEKEGEEKDGTESLLQECLDSCAELYIVEQMPHYIDYENSEAIEKYQVKIYAAEPCKNGCKCPSGIGISEQEIPEQNDDDQVEYQEIEYDVVFYNNDGTPDTTGYTEGKLRVEYGNDEEPNKYPVSLMISYPVTEINDNGEEIKENRECEIAYTILGGKIGGIEGTEPEPEIPTKPDMQGLGEIYFVDAYPSYCNEFERDTVDHCFYMCSQKYQVQTINNTVSFIAGAGAISATCRCFEGEGFQIGYGETFDKAQVYFAKDASPMCTAGFLAQNISTVIPKNEEYGDLFSISYTTSQELECTFTYQIKTGSVMGIEASEDGIEGASSTEVIICLVISVVIVLMFLVPQCMPADKKYQPVH